MTSTLIWFEGRFVAADSIAADDHGLLIGDGVFDTLAVHGGRAQHLDRHLRRLRDATARLGIAPVPEDDVIAGALERLITHHGRTQARVRITVTPGPGPSTRVRGATPTTMISIGDLPVPPTSIRLRTVGWVRNERSPLAGIKSTSWSENAQILRAIRAEGFDEAILCDTTGQLSECCAANLFLVTGDTIATPSLDAGCLPGVIREVLLERIAVEAPLTPDDLRTADAVFITSSTNGVVGASLIDDREFDPDAPGIRRARAALDDAR